MDKQARAKQVGDLLRARRKVLGLSIRAASDLIGIPHTTLQYIEKGENRRFQPQLPDPDNALKIAKAYGLEPGELFRMCGYSFEPPLTDAERALLDAYRKLPQQDQKDLVERTKDRVAEAKPHYRRQSNTD